MQTLRSQNIIERTSQGEEAWRKLTLDPHERAILGVLRRTQPVSELLIKNIVSTEEIENVLHRLAAQGWVRIHEPAEAVKTILEADNEGFPKNLDEDLQQLLERRRQDEELQRALDQAKIVKPEETWRGAECDLENDGVETEVHPHEEVRVPISEETLEFGVDNDGLLDALKNPYLFQPLPTEKRQAFAPPSGGLAALLKTLGEEVPPNAEVSPDQEESLKGLKSFETWGSIPRTEQSEGQASHSPFLRLKDQVIEENPTKPQKTSPHSHLFKQSLGKIQLEEEEAKAVRERALEHRRRQEQQAEQVNERRATQKANEIRQQQETTLLGLSKRLEKIFKDRNV